MSRNQRFVLLGVAAVIAVLAIVVLPGGGDDETTSTQPAAQTTETSTGTGGTEAEPRTSTEAEAPSEPAAPLLRAGRETELEAKQGDTVTFRVRSPTAEEVHVHGYDIKKDLEPGRTATVSFDADIEGIFEIELEQSGTELAKLTVEPR